MNGEASVRVGLRVADVASAAALYRGFGFQQVASVPGPDGLAVMTIMRRGDLQLLVDALDGLPFPDSERERQTKAGVRGLGVVIGVEVDDVDAAAQYCRSTGCEISVVPTDAPWGERYCECIDPFGYGWKFFRLLPGQGEGGLDSAHAAWFGHGGEP